MSGAKIITHHDFLIAQLIPYLRVCPTAYVTELLGQRQAVRFEQLYQDGVLAGRHRYRRVFSTRLCVGHFVVISVPPE